MLYTCARYFFCLGVSIARCGERSIRSYLNDRSGDKFQHVAGILYGVSPLLLSHDTRPKLSRLRVVVLLALVPVVALAAHDIVRDLVWCLRDVWPELVRKAVWRILLV